jgi:hypothetical protein
MKYAILGPQKGINRISDTEPKFVGELATVVEISNAKAAKVEAGRISDPKVFYFLIDGELKTMQEQMALKQATRQADMEAKRAEAEAARFALMTPLDKIKAGEAFVAGAGFSAARLVTLMDMMLSAKDAGTLESKPKLVALYTWLQTVKATALAGSITFPSVPYSFEEVVTE